jgi:hypothetical protein
LGVHGEIGIGANAEEANADGVCDKRSGYGLHAQLLGKFLLL